MNQDPQFRQVPRRAAIQRPIPRGEYARPAVTAPISPQPQQPVQEQPQPPVFIPSPLQAIATAQSQLVETEPEKVRWARLKKSSRLLASVVTKKRVYVPVASLAVLVLVGYGAYVGVQYIKTQGSPRTIYVDALKHALNVRSVHITEQVAGSNTSLAEQYNKTLAFNGQGSPVTFAASNIAISHATYHIDSYGTATDTFFRYSQLPSGVAATTTKAVNGKWVQLRQGNTLPAGVPAALFNATDPRSLGVGPMLFGNITPAAATKLADFYAEHKIFDFDSLAVTHNNVNGTKALVYKGKFDADYAKIATRSLSSTVGFSATDAQRAVDRLSVYKGAQYALWVDAAKRMPVKLTLTAADNTITTFNFDKINGASLPPKPVATIGWPEFANTQFQIESQASATVAASNRDSDRIAALANVQKNLLAYYTKIGSYPTLANMNDQTWVAANLTSFDPDTTRDPSSSSLALLAAVPVQAAAPVNAKTKPKITVPATPIFGYVYKPSTAAGVACLNQANVPTDQLCSLYSLSATLSNGQQYIVKNP